MGFVFQCGLSRFRAAPRRGEMKKPITLVILPGLDGTEVLFRPLLALLPDWIQPVVICYPASGPNEYADLLEIVRKKIAGLPSFVVLASSFSGPLSIMLAAAEPDRVRGLILSATFLRAPGRHLSSLRLIACGPIIWIMRIARRIPIWTLRRRDDPYRRAKAEIWRRVSARCLAQTHPSYSLRGCTRLIEQMRGAGVVHSLHRRQGRAARIQRRDPMLSTVSADRHNSGRSLRVVEERRMLDRGDHALRSGLRG